MNGYRSSDAYLETTVRSSDPVELTRLLYRALIDALRKAQQAHQAGDLAMRGRQAGKAQAILAELVSSLDGNSELSGRLNRLYDYALHLIQKAVFDQDAAPFEEARRLMETLLEAWERVEVPMALPGAAA